MLSTAPNWSDGVNDKARGQPIAASNFRFTGWTTTKGPAFRKKLRPSNAVNCAIDSATTKKCGVRRIHNRIDIKLRDIATEDLDPASGILHGSSVLQFAKHE